MQKSKWEQLRRPHFSLTEYVRLRLGRSPRQQAINFLRLPFGATSFAKFWWYWNPVFGYYLYYFCYKPVAGYLPRSMAVLVTFALSGVVHDLPFVLASLFIAKRTPSFTIALTFLFLGVVVVLAERLNISFQKIPSPGRWIIHFLNIFICWRVSLYLTS